MKIAVIGAGITGVCTAFELAQDGHAVVVLESNGSIAEGGSFANGCLIAPSLTQALSHPKWPSGAMSSLARLFDTARIKPGITYSDLRWLLGWSRPRPHESFLSAVQANKELIASSLERLHWIVQRTGITFDRGFGQMLLLKHERDAHQIEPKLATLKEFGVAWKALTSDEARKVEPGLGMTNSLHSAIQFPQDEIGNCRQFAQLLKDQAQRLGVDFRMNSTVYKMVKSQKIELFLDDAGPVPEDFDHVVVCTGQDPRGILGLSKIQVNCAAVQSYSLSLPIREALNAPRSAVFDLASRTSVVRNGARIRISGGAELGAASAKNTQGTIHQLYRALQEIFPGGANFQQAAQIWKGSSLHTTDALPLIGPSAFAGVYLNMAHGNNGWGMACGAARLVADLISGRSPSVNPSPFNPTRFPN